MHDDMPYGRNQGQGKSLKGSRPSVPHGTNFCLLSYYGRPLSWAGSPHHFNRVLIVNSITS